MSMNSLKYTSIGDNVLIAGCVNSGVVVWCFKTTNRKNSLLSTCFIIFVVFFIFFIIFLF